MSGPTSVYQLTDDYFNSIDLDLAQHGAGPYPGSGGFYRIDMSPLGSIAFVPVVDNDMDGWYTDTAAAKIFPASTYTDPAQLVMAMDSIWQVLC